MAALLILLFSVKQLITFNLLSPVKRARVHVATHLREGKNKVTGRPSYVYLGRCVTEGPASDTSTLPHQTPYSSSSEVFGSDFWQNPPVFCWFASCVSQIVHQRAWFLRCLAIFHFPPTNAEGFIFTLSKVCPLWTWEGC